MDPNQDIESWADALLAQHRTAPSHSTPAAPMDDFAALRQQEPPTAVVPANTVAAIAFISLFLVLAVIGLQFF
jgi:hypothetical protein